MSSRLRIVLAVVAFAALAVCETSGAATAPQDCPATNVPDTLVLQAGTPQWSKIGTPYGSPFQVGLANSNGCPVTSGLVGVPVTFSAPSSGAGGTFVTSGSNTAVVGTSAQGVAAAPQFTANHATGDYTVVATSQYGSVTFALHNTAAGVPAAIGAAGASRQSATTGGRYAQALQATVKDADGNPVEGVTVTFSLGGASGGAGGGGSGAAAAGATFDGGATQATALTGADGTATSPFFTANGTAGAFTASASTMGVVEPAAFSLRNVAGKPTRITALAPARQSTLLGVQYVKPLRVKLLDGGGKPVQGATVTFSLGSGGGGAGAGAGGAAGASFVGGMTQATAVTNSDGVASSPAFTANTVAGTFTAAATSSGTSAAATFALDNLSGRLVTLGADARSAIVGRAFGGGLRVELRDAGGKPARGVSVTFALGATAGANGASAAAGATFTGGGSQATVVTNAAGVATSPRLTANTVAGTFTATATVAGAAQAATFSLRNLAGRAKALAAGVAASESTAIGTRFPVRLAVTVTDGHQNPVPGAVVTFSAPARGASGRFAGGGRSVRVRTDADGIAGAPTFVANHALGGYVVRATVHGTHAAAFALVNLPAA